MFQFEYKLHVGPWIFKNSKNFASSLKWATVTLLLNCVFHVLLLVDIVFASYDILFQWYKWYKYILWETLEDSLQLKLKVQW